jgi:hypothetical protein
LGGWFSGQSRNDNARWRRCRFWLNRDGLVRPVEILKLLKPTAKISHVGTHQVDIKCQTDNGEEKKRD